LHGLRKTMKNNSHSVIKNGTHFGAFRCCHLSMVLLSTLVQFPWQLQENRRRFIPTN